MINEPVRLHAWNLTCTWMVRVPSRRAASSEAVLGSASLLLLGGFFRAESPHSRPLVEERRIRSGRPPPKLCCVLGEPRRPPPSLHASPATSTSKHATQRTLAHRSGRLMQRSAWKRRSEKFAKNNALNGTKFIGDSSALASVSLAADLCRFTSRHTQTAGLRTAVGSH